MRPLPKDQLKDRPRSKDIARSDRKIHRNVIGAARSFAKNIEAKPLKGPVGRSLLGQ